MNQPVLTDLEVNKHNYLSRYSYGIVAEDNTRYGYALLKLFRT
jgi:hypothetical protein